MRVNLNSANLPETFAGLNYNPLTDTRPFVDARFRKCVVRYCKDAATVDRMQARRVAIVVGIQERRALSETKQ